MKSLSVSQGNVVSLGPAACPSLQRTPRQGLFPAVWPRAVAAFVPTAEERVAVLSSSRSLRRRARARSNITRWTSLPAVASSLTERWAWLVSEAAVLSCSCPGLAHTARAQLCSSWDARCHFQPALAQHQRLPGELMDAHLLLLPRWFTSGEGFCFPCRIKTHRSAGRSASWHVSWRKGWQLLGTPDEEAWFGSRTRSWNSMLQAWLGEQLRP